jgi:hypothetical protein
MKIVFIAPETKKNSSHDIILELCQKLKKKVQEFYISFEHDKDSLNKIQQHFKSAVTAINRSDALVIEGSTKEADFGPFINVAMQQHKPTLLLHTSPISKSWMFSASRLIIVKQYSPKQIDELERLLKEFFDGVKKKKLIYRFNIMLNKEINTFLMDKAKDEGVSKADYIRQLIANDMDRTEE